MKIIDVIQGSQEWFAAKCGIPSASNFDKLITTKGEPSKQRKKYLYQLAGERVTGIPAESYQSEAMLRGQELEEEACKFYALATGKFIEKVGFCIAEEKFKCGCSPDRLVNVDGLLEVKCPIMTTHVGYLLDNTLPMDYFQQTQGQLLVTGRSYVDFLSYYPGLKPLIIRVERNERFLNALKVELRKFCLELEQVIKKIR
jgi:predicted phage-related endonuclease